MMARIIIAVSFALISFGTAAEVSADWFSDFFQGVAQDTKTRNYWPDQYLDAERATVCAPFCRMVNNGWRRQNMLGEYHFKPGTSELNEAGRKKVRWITFTCPRIHRMVYVRVADTAEETRARCEAVANMIAQLAPEDLPPVMTTTISEEGWSAAQADLIGRKYISSTPDPRLPDDESLMSGAGSGN